MEEMRTKAREAVEEQKRLLDEQRQKAATAEADNSSKTDTGDEEVTSEKDPNETEIDSEEADDTEEDEDNQSEQPTFSERVDQPVKSEKLDEGTKSMITKVSRGEILDGRPLHEGAIIQPAEMKNVFEKKGNLLVKAINNLMDKFLQPEPTEFDSEVISIVKSWGF